MAVNSPLQLTGQQHALYDALLDLEPRLAEMYYGALMAYTQSDNPVRVYLTAHGLREMLDKLPKYLALPMPDKPACMGGKVQDLSAHWKSAITRTACCNEGLWAGEIDRPIAKFLRSASEFFEWVERERPQRKQRTATILRDLDALGRPLPKPIENLRVEEWDTCYSYFASVAHFELADSFDDWIAHLERVLLDLLKPRTYEDHSTLDAIISLGESHD